MAKDATSSDPGGRLHRALLAAGLLLLAGIVPRPAGAAVQERLLQGVSAEGASVTATRSHGRIVRIGVEALHEWGYTLATYDFAGPALMAARLRKVAYPGYPQVDLARVPPHRPGRIAATDRVLSDDTLRFSGTHLVARRSSGRPAPVAGTDAATLAAEAGADARDYRALMDTPAPPGKGDGGAWVCVTGQDGRCQSYRPDDQ